MKCTNCGKNIASWHYRSSINGQVTEEHLCSECAEKRYGSEDVFSGFDRMFDGFFSPLDSLFGNGRSVFEDLDSFMMPTLVMPRIKLVLREKDDEAKAKEAVTERPEEDPELSRRRRINALREQMKAAAEKEDYEQAAKIRDQLRELEKSA